MGNVLLATAAGGRHGRSHAVPPLHEVQRGRHGDREAKVSALMAQESNQFCLNINRTFCGRAAHTTSNLCIIKSSS